MAQTLTEDKLGGSSSKEFSDLAWKFNNLNSAAKMLLVGTSSKSVPFIPISELVDTNNQNTPSTSALSLSTLSSPSPAPSIYSSQLTQNKNWEIKPAVVSTPSEGTKLVEELETFKPPLTPQHAAQEKAPTFKPVFYERNISEAQAPASTDLPEEYETEPAAPSAPLDIPSYNIPTATVAPLEIKPVETKFESKAPVVEPEEELYVPPTIQEQHRDFFEAHPYEGANAWSYHSEESHLETEEKRKGTFWGPFIRGTAKSAAVVTTIALLGFGAFYLTKTFKHNDDSLADLDNIDKEVTETPSASDTSTDSTISSTSSLDNKTFFEEKESTKTSTPSLAPAPEIDQKPIKQKLASRDDAYYNPTIGKSKKTIQTVKPKVYVSPSKFNSQVSKPANKAYQAPSSYSSNTNTVLPETEISSPIQPLFDPATVYDSAANEAIKPETYTAEYFPVEISYPKSGEQFEAAMVSPIGSQTSETSSDTADISRNYPEVEETAATTAEPQANTHEAPTFVVPQETATAPVADTQPAYVPAKLEQKTSQDEEIEPVLSPSSRESLAQPATVPVYTEPLNKTIEPSNVSNFQPTSKNYEDDLENIDDQPTLRKPIQSSSNQVPAENTFYSPYKTSTSPTTTTMVVQDKNRFAPSTQNSYKKSTPRRKFFGRFSHEYRKEAAVNNANGALNTYQGRLKEIQTKANSKNLSDAERQKLLREVESLQRSITQTQKELESRTAGKALSSSEQLKHAEAEANKVYLKPNFEQEQQELNEEESSLNISLL